MTRRFTSLLSALPIALGLLGCEPGDDLSNDAPAAQAQLLDGSVTTPDAGTSAADASTPAAPFVLTSSDVKAGEYILPKFRCPGGSPVLSWTAGPAGTQSYALIFRDQGNGFYHWAIFDIPAGENGLPGGVPVGPSLVAPKGAKQVQNWARAAGYGGPCGGDSTYVFTLYALDVATLPGVTARTTAAQLVTAIEAHDLASAKLSVRSKR